jgi:hypothetical protein
MTLNPMKKTHTVWWVGIYIGGFLARARYRRGFMVRNQRGGIRARSIE